MTERQRSASWAHLLVALTFLPAVACTAGGQPEVTPLLGHAGRWITDPSGRVVVIHGVNMVDKRPPYTPEALGFGEADARFLAQNGFNAVRVGVIWSAVEPSPGVYDDAYLARIRATVDVLRKRGIYALLDFHQDALNEEFGGEGFPDWAVREPTGLPSDEGVASPAYQRALDRFWANEPELGGVGLQDRYAAAAAHVAQYFVRERSVLGYDVFNEPYGGFAHPSCRVILTEPAVPDGGFDCTVFDGLVGAFEQRVTDAIRKVDGRHLVWYEPNVLFNWSVPTDLPPIRGEHLGLSFHAYCPPAGITFGRSCEQSLGAVLANADLRSEATGDALLATEFGNADAGILASFTRVADQRSMSWMMWAYCGCGNSTYPIPISPHVDDLVIDARRPPGGPNLEAAKFAALVRPYPTAIAGTPEGFGFDTATKTFSLRYTTKRVDGTGSFEAGACTDIFVPRLHYPHGYRVSVQGGRVTSANGAGLLTVRAESGAKQVSVSITPATGGTTATPVTGASC